LNKVGECQKNYDRQSENRRENGLLGRFSQRAFILYFATVTGSMTACSSASEHMNARTQAKPLLLSTRMQNLIARSLRAGMAAEDSLARA